MLLVRAEWPDNLVAAQNTFENFLEMNVTCVTNNVSTIQENRQPLISPIKDLFNMADLKCTDNTGDSEMQGAISILNKRKQDNPINFTFCGLLNLFH